MIDMLKNQKIVLEKEIKEKQDTLDYLNYKIYLYKKRKGDKE